MGLACWGLSKAFTQPKLSVIVNVARTHVYYEVEPIVAVTQMNASLITVGLLFERWQSKREFQTDLTQAFVAVRYRELDFLTTFLIKQKSSRHAAESEIFKKIHTYDYAALIVPTDYLNFSMG